MLTNYLKLSVRLLVRNPYFTFINVFGLAIGFSVFFGLWEFTSSELRTDQFHPGYERIARVYVDWNWTDDGKNWGHMNIAKTPPSLAGDLSRDFPEVESTLRIHHPENFIEGDLGHGSQVLVSHYDGREQVVFRETKMIYSDTNLFEFFNIPLLAGDKHTVLNGHNAIVLSASTAKKYFGDKDPVGKLLLLNDSVTLVVTGVFHDLPSNTHLDFECVVSNASRKTVWDQSQASYHVSTYVRLNNQSFESLEEKLSHKTNIYWNEIMRRFPQVKAAFVLQPLRQVAFDSHGFANQYFTVKSEATLKIFRAVSVTILLMAWMNCLNLTITRMSRRTKEIAARKMTGAKSRDFLMQFFVEAVILNLLAVLMAATFLQLMRDPAYTLLEIHIQELREISLDTKLTFILVMVAGILITGLYPAVISFKRTPAFLFKLNFKGRTGKLVPSILTTMQYSAGIILVFCGIIIHRQLNFILNKELGWDKSNVMVIDPPTLKTSTFATNMFSFKEQLESNASVESATIASQLQDFKLQRIGSGMNFVMTDGFAVQESYIPFFKLTLLAGRNFEPDEKSGGIIISRIGTQRLGFSDPHDAIGQEVMLALDNNSPSSATHIIGVIEDFRVRPFFETQNNSEAQTGRGYAFAYAQHYARELAPDKVFVRVSPENFKSAVKEIGALFSKVFPGNIFSTSFLEEQINNSYAREKTTRNQIAFFTFLAIGIACLGLLAMISNTIEEKTKEIGIRKALGAGILNIIRVLIGSSVVQLIVSIIIGIPLAWYIAVEYLQRYSERIPIRWWYFTFPAVILVGILFITIASLLWKATRTNPADTLRYE